MRLRVIEPFRSPFYAPLFVSLHGGHFAAEGLDVEVVTAGKGQATTQAVLDGTADIALSGLMRSFGLVDRGGPVIVHFAEVNSRNGFFLLARRPRADFTWRDLVGRTVISFAEAPTPWQCMLTVLRRAGIDPARVTIVRDLPVDEAVAAFRAGRGDFLEQGQPVVERLVAEGTAHVVASMGEATGPIPFSSYMTTPARLRERPDVMRGVVRALHRTQRWMATHGGAEIATTIAPAFPDVPPALLVSIVERYRRQATWPGDPVLRRPGFEALQQILLDGGFIRHRHRYEDLVDTALARSVVGEARE